MLRRTTLIICVSAALAAGMAFAAGEKQLSLLGGALQDSDTLATSMSWQLQYLQTVGDHEAVSFSWLNEGHLDNHHRDGPCTEFWLRSKTLRDRLTLGAGLGPYYYFDTTRETPGAPYSNDHGWGAILSLDAEWQLTERWLADLRFNFTKTTNSIDTRTLNFGFGYLLSSGSGDGGSSAGGPGTWAKREEIDLLGGRTIVNSFESEKSLAGYIDYRRSLARYVDWSVGLLSEGDPRLSRRHGLVTEIWEGRRFSGGLWSLGVGAGAYLSVDRRRSDYTPGAPFLSGIVTLSATRRLSPDWQARVSWSRIVTGYDRDADVLLVGVGHSLGGTRF